MLVVGVVVVVVGVGVAEGGESHGHQFGEEEDEDGHEGDSFGPVVFCYGSRETWVGQGI